MIAKSDIPYSRLCNQQLVEPKFNTPKEIVSWMGAIQAQDYNMAKWGIGVRLPGSTDKSVESAIDKGEIIRTHLMRPTWHFVSSDDIYWMLELTAPRIKMSMKSRDKVLELNDNIYEKTNFLIENALKGGKNLPREELIEVIKHANIATHINRASHFLMRAELDGIICSGKIKNNKITYALLEERVPGINKVSREDALSLLAQKYFTSHCPATLQDFVWWSGLSVTAAQQAIESIKTNLFSEKIDKQNFWFTNSLSFRDDDKNSVLLLPAYDEFTISYRDRSASMPIALRNTAVSNNGIFRPIIVVNGLVVGLWKRINQKDVILIEINFFQPVTKSILNLIEKTTIKYGNFMNKKVDLVSGLNK